MESRFPHAFASTDHSCRRFTVEDSLCSLAYRSFFQDYLCAQKADWQIYEEDLALAEMVEPRGFDSALWS
jgi:hypothetical protein